MSESSKPMTQSDAARIQSHADQTNTNQGFKQRAQSAAAKNQGGGKNQGGKTSGKEGGRK